MDDAFPLSPTAQKWGQNIFDTAAAILLVMPVEQQSVTAISRGIKPASYSVK